jgi:F-type H+-transporting ATPase subunit delta
MSEQRTIARPYAHAVFDLARESGSYEAWSRVLAIMAAAAADTQLQDLARNPRFDDKSLAGLLEDICGDALFPDAQNFIRLVVRNERVLALPGVTEQFEAMRAEAEGTIEAELISALGVSEEQKTKIAASLSRRLGREVSLRVTEDPSLIGGAVLRAGDMVVDASLKGHLQKLATSLSR